jgi:hypothetical protein
VEPSASTLRLTRHLPDGAGVIFTTPCTIIPYEESWVKYTGAHETDLSAHGWLEAPGVEHLRLRVRCLNHHHVVLLWGEAW